MDLIAQLEATFDGLLERIDVLEQENERLRVELEQTQGGTREIQTRVELLLQKVREKLG